MTLASALPLLLEPWDLPLAWGVQVGLAQRPQFLAGLVQTLAAARVPGSARIVGWSETMAQTETVEVAFGFGFGSRTSRFANSWRLHVNTMVLAQQGLRFSGTP